MLADDIDGALARGDQITQCVFSVVEAARDTDCEERWIAADDVGVGVGGEVGRTPFFGEKSKLEKMSPKTLTEEDLIPSSDLVLTNPIGLGIIPEINSL